MRGCFAVYMNALDGMMNIYCAGSHVEGFERLWRGWSWNGMDAVEIVNNDDG